MFLQETCFQPLPEQRLVHGDVRQEPIMADAIKASFDVPFKNPLWTVPVTQQDMDLFQGIGTAAFPPKAIGMAVGLQSRLEVFLPWWRTRLASPGTRLSAISGATSGPWGRASRANHG